MKILIVGFGRSGTTMTFRTIRSNPLVKGSFLESCLLAFYNKEKLYQKHPCFNSSVVEKIIYGGDKLRKRAFGTLDISIFDYCKMWLDYFEDEARIVQLIRHPLDTLSSLIIKSGRRKKVRKNLKEITINDIPLDFRERLISSYFKVVPKYPKLISTLPNTQTFKYEGLVLDGFKELFDFCGLPANFGETMRRDRAFNYRRSGFNVDSPIRETVQEFNKLVRKRKYTVPRGSK